MGVIFLAGGGCGACQDLLQVLQHAATHHLSATAAGWQVGSLTIG